MKKIPPALLTMIWILFLICTTILTGCTTHKTEKSVDFPFEIADIISVDAYHYEGVPAAAEKKSITEKNDIEELYNYFESLKLQNSTAEKTAGGTVTLFRFHLADDTQYEISYLDDGTKSGLSILVIDDAAYYTASDIEEYWFNLSHDAIPVDSPDW